MVPPPSSVLFLTLAELNPSAPLARAAPRDVATSECDLLVGLLDDERIVGGAHHRRLELVGQAHEQAGDRNGVLLVETRGRLVREQRRARRNRARNGHSRAFARREPRDVMLTSVGHADHGQRLRRLGPRALGWNATQRETELDVLPRGQEREETGILLDEAHVRAAEPRPSCRSSSASFDPK